MLLICLALVATSEDCCRRWGVPSCAVFWKVAGTMTAVRALRLYAFHSGNVVLFSPVCYSSL